MTGPGILPVRRANPEAAAETSAALRQQSIDLLLEIMDLQAAPNPELARKQRLLLEALSRRAKNPPPASSGLSPATRAANGGPLRNGVQPAFGWSIWLRKA